MKNVLIAVIVIALAGCGEVVGKRKQIPADNSDVAAEFIIQCISSGTPDSLTGEDVEHYDISKFCWEAAMDLYGKPSAVFVWLAGPPSDRLTYHSYRCEDAYYEEEQKACAHVGFLNNSEVKQ